MKNKLFTYEFITVSALLTATVANATNLPDWIDEEPIKARLHSKILQDEFDYWGRNAEINIACFRSKHGYWTSTIAIDTGLPDSEGASFEWLYELHTWGVSVWLNASKEKGPYDRHDEFFYGDTVGSIIRDVVVYDWPVWMTTWDYGIDPYNEREIEPRAFRRVAKALVNQGCRDPYVVAAAVHLGVPGAEALLEPNVVEMNARKRGYVLRIPRVSYDGMTYTTKLRLNYDGTYEFITVDLLEGER